MHSSEDIDRFYEKIQQYRSFPCWYWNGPINTNSKYGIFCYKGKQILAHRFSYEIFVGPIPETHVVKHTCATKDCVNPKHLFLKERITSKKTKDKLFLSKLPTFEGGE